MFKIENKSQQGLIKPKADSLQKLIKQQTHSKTDQEREYKQHQEQKRRHSFHRFSRDFFKHNGLLQRTLCNLYENVNEMDHFLEKWFAKMKSRRNGKLEQAYKRKQINS